MVNSQTPVLLQGDSALVTVGLRHILETTPDFRVICAALTDTVDAKYLATNGIRIAVVDAHASSGTQLSHVRGLKAADPNLAVALVTGENDPDALAAVVAAGTDALLDVTVSPDALIAVLRLLRDGVRFVTTHRFWPAILNTLQVQGEDAERLACLTRREREVYGYLRDGRTDREIADALTLSLWTVKHHVANILQKLEFKNRREVLRA